MVVYSIMMRLMSPRSRMICMPSDDTDVFVPLVYWLDLKLLAVQGANGSGGMNSAEYQCYLH